VESSDLEDLKGLVGADYVRTGDAVAAYHVCGVLPEAVAAPGTREEAAAVIDLARDRGWSVVPYGGGTWTQQGNAPARLDLLLSTRRLTRIIAYEPDDMTVTVEPGVTLSVLGQTLATRQQFLPLDPPLPSKATVGGTIAAAVSGPWRAGFGTPRDWVIGCRVIGADGLDVRGGGQVVKNVAGYDLPKLYTGSFGTLGLISELTFKVMPHGGMRGLCRVTLPDAATCEALTAQIRDSDLQPTAVELAHATLWEQLGAPLPGGRSWGMLVEFMDIHQAVEWQGAQLSGMCATLGAGFEVLMPEVGESVRNGMQDFAAQPAFLALISTVGDQVAAIASEMEALLTRFDQRPSVLARAATGQLLVGAEGDFTVEAAEMVRTVAQAHGATCRFGRLPVALMPFVDSWGPLGPEARLMKGIKQRLDPSGVFSPRRFAGGI
jgi:glycolate oxidase FAD binding subunit